jgi:hypothetical protein
MYKLTKSPNTIIRLADGACITLPPAEGEGYQYADWLAAGNTPTPADVPSLAQNIATLVARIRTEASAIVADTVGALSNEYAQAKLDADAFKAASYIGPVPSSVSSWATAKGWTSMQACDDILLAAANWVGAQAAIRSNRLARAEAAKACTTQAQLNTVAAQWAGFVAAIRSQLGV